MTKYNATQFELFGAPKPVKRRETPEEQREQIYALVAFGKRVTTGEITDVLGLPESVVTLRLRELVKEGRIRSVNAPQSNDQTKPATLWVLGNQADYRPF